MTLAACQTPAGKSGPAPASAPPSATTDGQAGYRQAALPGEVWQLDADASQLRVYVFRGGTAARMGHNHVLRVTALEGHVHLPSGEPTQARFDLRVPLQSLAVDEPALRAETGDGFSGERSTTDIEGTRANMLGERGLQADRFPFVHVKSVAVAGDWPVLVAEVEITLRGVSRRQSVALRVTREAGILRIGGALVLRQSDFGITPYAVFGGLLAVQDAVVVSFDLVARPAGD